MAGVSTTAPRDPAAEQIRTRLRKKMDKGTNGGE
jgi:hypothetical protein